MGRLYFTLTSVLLIPTKKANNTSPVYGRNCTLQYTAFQCTEAPINLQVKLNKGDVLIGIVKFFQHKVQLSKHVLLWLEQDISFHSARSLLMCADNSPNKKDSTNKYKYIPKKGFSEFCIFWMFFALQSWFDPMIDTQVASMRNSDFLYKQLKSITYRRGVGRAVLQTFIHKLKY